jgi:transglutaminase-like putative cysteine protease
MPIRPKSTNFPIVSRLSIPPVIDSEAASPFITKTYEIALPTDIPKVQQVMHKFLNPAPHSVYQDKDGNIIAKYKVTPKKKLDIELIGSVKILGRQIEPAKGGKLHEIPTSLVKRYTKVQPFWEVDSLAINELANKLFDASKTVSENAQSVYLYITKNLKYNFEIAKEEAIIRNGALAALTQEGRWACMEFTDLFITLTRAMGIPARELDGYAFATAETISPIPIDFKVSDTLHAWAEFYDPTFGWVQVDPTWGHTSKIDYFTKLDTNHFAFVIKGLNSEYPLPAGSYRFSENEKQVSVDFAQEMKDFNATFTLQKALTLNPVKLLAGNQKYVLRNEGGIVTYNINDTKKTLLPFEKTEIYLPRGTTQVTFEDINGVNTTQKIHSVAKIPASSYIGLALGITLTASVTLLFIKLKKKPTFWKKVKAKLRRT